jgi:hypothetical protein
MIIIRLPEIFPVEREELQEKDNITFVLDVSMACLMNF